ncbi:UDP-glycosyltransferase family 49 member B2 [Carabus blaptoides fortunei]
MDFSGVHLNPSKPLPQEIQEFLDDAPNGVVYFSLGSNIKSSLLSKKLKQEICNTFNELPYRVLWKFEQSNFTKLSNNVKIAKWLPQQDILSHPNIKVFITQGGLQSLEEAIRKRVPLVGMPFYIDQPKNMDRMEKLGIGKVIDKATLTKKSFKKIIIEVAENSKYRKNVERVATLLDDQPMKSLDKVVWWIDIGCLTC